jgi:hypothetical protein
MENYCQELNIFSNLKENFFKNAFISGKPGCHPAVLEATKLYNFTQTNPTFLKEMRRGCSMGGFSRGFLQGGRPPTTN